MTQEEQKQEGLDYTKFFAEYGKLFGKLARSMVASVDQKVFEELVVKYEEFYASEGLYASVSRELETEINGKMYVLTVGFKALGEDDSDDSDDSDGDDAELG